MGTFAAAIADLRTTHASLLEETCVRYPKVEAAATATVGKALTWPTAGATLACRVGRRGAPGPDGNPDNTLLESRAVRFAHGTTVTEGDKLLWGTVWLDVLAVRTPGSADLAVITECVEGVAP